MYKSIIVLFLVSLTACDKDAQVSERFDASDGALSSDAGTLASDVNVTDLSDAGNANALDAANTNTPDVGDTNVFDAANTNAPDVDVNRAPELGGMPVNAIDGQAFEFVPSANDDDGDPLTFSSSERPNWLVLNEESGRLFGTPSEGDIGTHEFTLRVSDGELEAELALTIRVRSAIEVALERGDAHGLVGEERLMRALLQSVEQARTKYRSAKAEIFALNSDLTPNTQSLTNIDWNPTHDASILGARFFENETILTTNDVSDAAYDVDRRSMAVIGENESARYMVMGGNPLRNAYRQSESVNEQMHVFLERSMGWLTRRQDLKDAPFNIVMANLSQSYYFPDEVANRQWFEQRFAESAQFNAAGVCDDDALIACLQSDTDLLIVSGYESLDDDLIAAGVAEAMRRGIAVLYLHYDGGHSSLAQALLPLFDVTREGDNYWRKLRFTNFDVGSTGEALPSDIGKAKALIEHFQSERELDLSACDDKSCPLESEYNTLFLDAVEPLRRSLRNLDAKHSRLFEQQRGRYEKLMILLGDVFREGVLYPIDKNSTPSSLFLRSMFADHTVYNSRAINHVQPDMGNFSRSDFTHVTATRKSVSLVAKPNFRSTGAYALPGQTFRVTRSDANPVNTAIFINTLRSGATHEFQERGYKRPKHLQSAHIELKSGETIALTSPHGGTIQVSFDAKDVEVDLHFENVGEHAYWASAADDDTFASALERNDYDWTELVTPTFEVHSTSEKMRQSIENVKWQSAAAIAQATERYMSNLPHVLAGFQGPGIDSVDEITDFALARGLEIETLDIVKHMNADQANCGYGCSGNPYDAYWSFDPIGHGDIHELGHGLEKSRLRFEGWEGHASTNPYSYYSKSIYLQDTNATLDDADCQLLPFEELYAMVQQSLSTAAPSAFMQSQNLTRWNQGVAMQIQFMMAAQAEGILEKGWHLLARLHIIERAFAKAVRDDTRWEAEREALGFETMTRSEAQSLGNNDWNLIALATATGRNMKATLDLFGLVTSDEAKAFVAAKGLPSMPVRFFDARDDDYCLGLDKSALPLNLP